MNDANYIGLDVHQATISATVLDSTGKLIMEAILETKAETILQFIRGLRGSSQGRPSGAASAGLPLDGGESGEKLRINRSELNHGKTRDSLEIAEVQRRDLEA